MARPIKRLQAAPAVVAELRRRSRARTSMVRERERAEMILLRLDGVSVGEIAVRLNTTPKRVSMWSKRFETHGLGGLEEACGRGRKPSIPVEKIERVVTDVTRPPENRNRWSVRSMSRHAGVNAYLIERNANPQPYKWTAKGEAILEKVHRARAALQKDEAA